MDLHHKADNFLQLLELDDQFSVFSKCSGKIMIDAKMRMRLALLHMTAPEGPDSKVSHR